MGQMRDRALGDPAPFVYNRALWEAPNPYPFGPDHWAFVEMHRQLSIPEKRLEAFANVANNGAKCTIVLAMDPNATWESVTTIRNNTNKLSQLQTIAQYRSVQRFMVDTIERIGVAARGNRVDTEWQLTPFGVAIKPAIIYTQEMCMLLGINPTDVFGNVSIPTTDATGNIITTPAARRVGLLEAIYDALEETGAEEVGFQTVLKRNWTLIDITDGPDYNDDETDGGIETENMEVVDNASINHLRDLVASKLVEVTMANTAEGEFVKYKANPKSLDETWQPNLNRYWESTKELWNKVQAAVRNLQENGNQNFGSRDVKEKLKESGLVLLNEKIIPPILAELARLGYLENITGLSDKKRSIVKLTPLGRNVHELITSPLYEWFINPNLTPVINQAAESYTNNPQGYHSLVRQIALNYRDNSSFINADSAGKKAKIIELVRQNKEKLTAVEIAALLGITRWNAYDLCHDLIKAGEVITTADPNNRTRKLYGIPQKVRRSVRSSQRAS